MTRRAVYGSGLLLTIACTITTIASIALPRWVSYNSPNDKREDSIGLHKRCSTEGICHSFPRDSVDCLPGEKSFCHMWRTVGFLTSFTVVVELATLVGFVVIISGGVQRRSVGWKVISSLLFLSAIIECTGMAIVAFLFEHDDRFPSGWYLDNSFILATASWSTLVLAALGIIASALFLPEEGDYELLPNYQMVYEQDEQ